jgi:hypothetical protein
MTIFVANQSKRVSDADVRAMTAACDSQVFYHAAPLYGYKPRRVQFTADPKSITSDALIIVADTPDEANALGWHSEQASGQSYGFVFAAPVLDNGGDALYNTNVSVSSVLSHEVLETCLNPGVNVSADDGQGWLWAYEVCDPVEGDSYPIYSKIMVSNFVLPAFFDQAGKGRVDFMGTAPGPFRLARHGYAARQASTGKQAEIFGDQYIPWYNGAKG